MAANYTDRRYRVIDGRLQKQYEVPPPDGWFLTKKEAWASWDEAVAAAPKTAHKNTVSVGYGKRRYCIIDGKLAKSWDSNPGWFMTKDEAWAAHAAESAAPEARQDAKEPPETAPDPAASETPPVNGGEPDTAATSEVEGPETPEPESTEETPELELATSPPAPQPAPEATPPAPQQVIRMPELMRRVNQSRTAIDRGIKAGTFPPPDLDLGDGQRGWFRATIEDMNPAEPEPEVA